MSAIYFVGAIIWGSFAAQLFIQATMSLSIAAIYLYGLLFSPVKKEITLAGFVGAIAQAALSAALFAGGFVLIETYVHPSDRTVSTTAGFIAFVATFIYCFIQVPDRILVARLAATVPYFAERARRLAPNRKLSGEEAHQILAELRGY